MLRFVENLLATLRGLFRRRRGPRRLPAARDFQMPSWAEAGKERRKHVQRVAALLAEWADEMDVGERERDRWLQAACPHAALRGARLAAGVTHGAAAADRAAQDGETDRGVLDAIRHHSVGHAGWDDVGRMLYLADALEPGRQRARKRRARLAEQVPRERDGVLRKVVAHEIRRRLRAGRPVHPQTIEFWNSLLDG